MVNFGIFSEIFMNQKQGHKFKGIAHQRGIFTAGNHPEGRK
jgi:hypothetical protein